MHEERLLQLRRVVAAAPEERFSMIRWSYITPCGTAYCAAGWAAIDPWFRANTEIGTIFVLDPEDGTLDPLSADIVGELATLFAVDHGDAARLFCAGHWRPVAKAEVLDNIDRLLQGAPATDYPPS